MLEFYSGIGGLVNDSFRVSKLNYACFHFVFMQIFLFCAFTLIAIPVEIFVDGGGCRC